MRSAGRRLLISIIRSPGRKFIFSAALPGRTREISALPVSTFTRALSHCRLRLGSILDTGMSKTAFPAAGLFQTPGTLLPFTPDNLGHDQLGNPVAAVDHKIPSPMVD